MRVVAGVQQWRDGGDAVPASQAATALVESWEAAAPHCAVTAHAVGDGGPRSADAVAGSRAPAGGAEVVQTASGLLLAPRAGQLRWNPQDLATALLGLAADARASASRTTVLVPVGDEPPAGDATDLWGGGLEAFRTALAPITVIALVSSSVPLLGFHGMSAALRDRRESDLAVAAAAQEQEARWSAIARRADAVAGSPSLLGPARLSDAPGSGAAGGLAYCLGAAGARLTPASAEMADLAGLPKAISAAGLAVGVVETLSPRALDHGLAAPLAATAGQAAVPCVLIAGTVQVGKRDLMQAGIAAAYAAGDGLDALREMAGRVARTWTPQR